MVGGVGFDLFFALSSFSICSMRESKSARLGLRDGCRGVEADTEAGIEGGGAEDEEDFAVELEGTMFVFFSFAGPGTKAVKKSIDISACFKIVRRNSDLPPRSLLSPGNP